MHGTKASTIVSNFYKQQYTAVISYAKVCFVSEVIFHTYLVAVIHCTHMAVSTDGLVGMICWKIARKNTGQHNCTEPATCLFTFTNLHGAARHTRLPVPVNSHLVMLSVPIFSSQVEKRKSDKKETLNHALPRPSCCPSFLHYSRRYTTRFSYPHPAI